MERPKHDLAAAVKGSKQSRFTSGAVAIGINVAIIAALVAGLSSSQLRQEMLDISASVVAKKVTKADLPPPPPAMVRPPAAVAAPPPQIVIAAPPPVVEAPKAVAAPPPPPPPTELKAIEATHSLPPYPALSQRMGEQGTTLMKVNIDTTGKVTEVTIVTSSGSTRLDTAAVEYVKANWRWQPPTQGGKPVSATTEVSVKWDLKNAQ